MAFVLREISDNGNISGEKRIVFKSNREEDKENYVEERVKPIQKVKELSETSINDDGPENNSIETDDKKNSIEEFPKPSLDYDLLESSVEEYHETDNEPKSSSSPEEISAKVVQTKTTKGSFKSPAKVALLFGYIGIGHKGFYPTRNRNAQNLYNDIVKAIFASEHPHKKIRLTNLKIACKTPEDGSALCQVVVLPRFEATLEERLDKINENLPDHVVCFGARKVIPTFHPKHACKIDEKSNYQKFKYFLPSYALDPNCEEFVYNYRVSNEVLDKANGILKEFVGKHFFHNFSGTLKGAANVKNCRRVIKAQCEEPYVIDGLEMVELTFMGDNFMVLQVPSIVGFVLAYMRGYASKKTLSDAWEPPLMNLPCAPASGLLLENIRYGSYNCDLIRKEYRDENGRIYCPLDWSSEDDKVAGLRATIVASIVHLEKTERTTAKFIKNELGKHSYRKFTTKNGPEKLSRKTSRVSLSKKFSSGNIENQLASTSAQKEITFDQLSKSAKKSNLRKAKKSPKSGGKEATDNSFNLARQGKTLDQSSSSDKKKKRKKSTKRAGKEAFNLDKIEKVLDSIPGTAQGMVRDALLDAIQQATQDISKMVRQTFQEVFKMM